jgi:hypothetical protein
MSDIEQSKGTNGSAQPQSSREAQTVPEVVVDDAGAQPTYANFCRVTATPEELVLDFGLNPQPFAAGRQAVKASQKVVMNFFTAKRLVGALGMTMQRHEHTFGTLELDVGRRATAPKPQVSQTGTPVLSGLPEVLKQSR